MSLTRIQKVNQFKQEIYREYGYYYYVPMAEAYAIQVPVTVGCSYNSCLYCKLNQDNKFRELSLDEIAGNITKLRYIHEERLNSAKRFLLAGGNPFVLSTEKLLAVAEIIRKNFPECEYISCFSRADDITRKSPEELNTLRSAGFNRLCIGIESGSDEVLAFQNKGITAAQNLEAMKALEDSQMKYSCYIMLGLGGLDMSEGHVTETARLLNQANPFELTVVTLVLFKGAALIERVKAHEFRRMHPLEALKEGREILSRLEINTIWDATHKTNLFPVKGKIPEHKEKLLKRINDVISEIESGDLKQYELKRWSKWGTE
ncbi:MAG: radical SAM protein [Synergistaceae bacterium]|nr:radical SAM protein [Synergistaceae bacterium]